MKKFFLFIILSAYAVLTYAQDAELIIKRDERGSLYLDHIVVPKEGLYAIGRLYNVNPKFIAAYNKIDINHGINIDQVLRIPLTDTNFSQSSISGIPVYYEVKAGDGLLKVSNENNKVLLKDLREWNSLGSDNIQAGTKLIIGFLNSKEMIARRANSFRSQPVAKQTTENKLPENKPEEKRVDPVTEPVTASRPESVAQKESSATLQSIPAVVKDPPVKPVSSESGYFRAYFDQQIKTSPVSKDATVTASIFKTTSGWKDGKYYLLIDGVTPGTIVKIVNPENSRTVYAKVLGEMNGIRQNQGLDIRISNAAASALQINDEEKFVVKVNY